MLTGDKLETATCTAKNAHLVTRTQDIHIFRLVSNTCLPLSQDLFGTPSSGTGGLLRPQLFSNSRPRIFLSFWPSCLFPELLFISLCALSNSVCCLAVVLLLLLRLVCFFTPMKQTLPQLPSFSPGDEPWRSPPRAERLPSETRLRSRYFW